MDHCPSSDTGKTRKLTIRSAQIYPSKQNMSERGGQSPPPERQSGKQQRDPPASGHGVNEGSKNKEESESQLKDLTSNPKGPLDDHIEELAKKKYKNVAGELTEIN
jgi:hypothetical protein